MDAGTGTQSGGAIANTLSGAVADAFEVTRVDNGTAFGAAELRFKTSPHFESGKTSYSITITATDDADRTGSESITISITDVGETPYLVDDDSTTGQVLIDDSATGTLEEAFDKDWFAVELVAGNTYNFDLEGSVTGSGTLDDPLLQLFSPASDFIVQNDDGGDGRNSRIEDYLAEQTGTHFLQAGGYSDAAGTNTLRTTRVASGDDYADTSGTTGSVALGGTVTGSLEAEFDKDWFAVDLVAGGTYQFDLLGEDGGGGTLPDPSLGLYNAAGDLLAENDDFGNGLDSRLSSFVAPSTGTYYLEAGAYSDETGTYTLSTTIVSPPVPGDDFPDDSGTTTYLSPGQGQAGELEDAGDVDAFWLSMVEGQHYTVTVTPDSLDDRDVSVQLALANLGQLGGIDLQTGTANSFSFTAPVTTDALISVQGGSEAETGGYTVLFEEIALPATPNGVSAFALDLSSFESGQTSSSKLVNPGTLMPYRHGLLFLDQDGALATDPTAYIEAVYVNGEGETDPITRGMDPLGVNDLIATEHHD